jgi:transcription initiation factor TFIID TATA-box-binding protein
LECKVVNVVSTADLQQYVDLSRLNKQSWGRYDLEFYPAGYIKDGWMQGKVTVFHTGKLISVGASSIRASLNSLNHAKGLLISAAIVEDVKLKPQVRNIVATVSLGHVLNLENLANQVRSMIYEPEVFPGGIIRSKGESTSFLIFASGKAVIAGAKSLAELRLAYQKLEEFEKVASMKTAEGSDPLRAVR